VQSLEKDQLLGLLAEAQKANREHWLMFLVGYWHGLRVSEILALTPAMIADGYLTVQRLKGSMRTTQPLIFDENPLLNEGDALLEHIRNLDPSQRLFPLNRRQFDRLMVRYGKTAKVPRHLCHAHVLKHSIAMHTIKHAGIENVRVYLGHRSIASTGAYLKVSDAAASSAIRTAAK